MAKKHVGADTRRTIPLSTGSDPAGPFQPGESRRLAVPIPDDWGGLDQLRLFISMAAPFPPTGVDPEPTWRGAAEWSVEDIEIDGVSQLGSLRPLPGQLFGDAPLTKPTLRRNASRFLLELAPARVTLAVTIKLSASAPQPAHFYGAAHGVSPAQLDPAVIQLAAAVRVEAGETKTISHVLERAIVASFWVIENPHAWLVCDLRIDGESRFVGDTGPLPADMFLTWAVDSYASLPGLLHAGQRVELDVRPVTGAGDLSATLEGEWVPGPSKAEN